MKKWLAILGVITCLFGLTACGSTNSRIEGDLIDPAEESQWVSSGEQLVTYLDQISEAGQSADLESDAVFGPAIQSWESAKGDIGTVQGYQNEYAVMSAQDEISINIGIDGSDHDADVVIVAALSDYGVETKSVTTNVQYSFGELIGQAGLNTLLGMGTTFVVLILLALIINCFKYIPKIQAAFARKAPAEEVKAAPTAPAPAAAAVEEVPADDTELIAVIAAAIAASEGMATTDGFVVRSIRKSRKKF
ncbi:MAG: OadG family protein [Lachnospiraceae bacterium]|nr:OadG family protein [Lachnospiraceae bacterium]